MLVSVQLVAVPSFCKVVLDCRPINGNTLVREYAYSLWAVLTFGVGIKARADEKALFLVVRKPRV